MKQYMLRVCYLISIFSWAQESPSEAKRMISRIDFDLEDAINSGDCDEIDGEKYAEAGIAEFEEQPDDMLELYECN